MTSEADQLDVDDVGGGHPGHIDRCARRRAVAPWRRLPQELDGRHPQPACRKAGDVVASQDPSMKWLACSQARRRVADDQLGRTRPFMARDLPVALDGLPGFERRQPGRDLRGGASRPPEDRYCPIDSYDAIPRLSGLVGRSESRICRELPLEAIEHTTIQHE